MIVPGDIVTNDIVKVLVNEDDVEEELYGIVGMNTGNVLGVYYLSQTNKLYKSACVFEIDNQEMNPVPYESLTEHYPSGTIFEDLGIKKINTNMYVIYDEIDSECADSEIYEDSADSETDSEFDDFIVPDGEIDYMPLPENHKSIDAEWNNWKPSTPGAQKFKNTVDAIEMYARMMNDEAEF